MFVVVRVESRYAETVNVFKELDDAISCANNELNKYREAFNLTEFGIDGVWDEATGITWVAWCNTDKNDLDFHIIEI